MSITDELLHEILEDIRTQKTATQEIEQALTKFNMTEKELLIFLWNQLKIRK